MAEKEEYFKLRTKSHIKGVQDAVEKIANRHPKYKTAIDLAKHHDANKFIEPLRSPYIEIVWKRKNELEKGEPMDLTDAEVAAIKMHTLTSPHHPEFWSLDKIEFSEDGESLKSPVDVRNMPPLAIAEMVADWEATAEERKLNTAREWFESQWNVRWKFSPRQEILIEKFLIVFEDEDQL